MAFYLPFPLKARFVDCMMNSYPIDTFSPQLLHSAMSLVVTAFDF